MGFDPLNSGDYNRFESTSGSGGGGGGGGGGNSWIFWYGLIAVVAVFVELMWT